MKSKTPLVIVVLLLMGGVFYYANDKTKPVGVEDDHKVVVSDINKYIPGVPLVFIDETLKGTKINKVWKFPEGIEFRVVSEDLNDRIAKMIFAVSSPDKPAESVIAMAQSEMHKFFIFRSSGKINGGVFYINVGPWEGYKSNTNTAEGVKISASFKIKEINESASEK